jgi:hypothetical protein
MKNKIKLYLAVFLSIVLTITSIVSVVAIDFTPKGDINMQGYNIKGIPFQGNVSADYGFLKINWSWIQNVFNFTSAAIPLINTASINLESNISAVNSSLITGIGTTSTNLQSNITNLNSTYNKFWYNQSGNYQYNQTYTGGTYNSTYDALNSTYNKFWYNQTYSGSTYNDTYNTWAYNMSGGGTASGYNETYNNLLNKSCAVGYAFNGTSSTGEYSCIEVGGTSSGGENNVALINNVNTYNTVSNTDNRAYPSTALVNNVITYEVNNVTGDILPTVNNLYSIGSSLLRWLKGWFESLDVSGDVLIGGNLNVSGNTTLLGGNSTLIMPELRRVDGVTGCSNGDNLKWETGGRIYCG